jgi:hypothetical protein
LTFGHIHTGSIGSISAALASTADGSDGSAGAPSSPAQKIPTGLDFCAICNHIGLASALVLPVSAATIPPTLFIQELQWPWLAIGFASRDHFHFNARGPPHA